MSRKVWTVLAVLILGSTAHASIISTGLGLGGGECNVTNIGTKPVTVKSVTIINGEGTSSSSRRTDHRAGLEAPGAATARAAAGALLICCEGAAGQVYSAATGESFRVSSVGSQSTAGGR